MDTSINILNDRRVYFAKQEENKLLNLFLLGKFETELDGKRPHFYEDMIQTINATKDWEDQLDILLSYAWWWVQSTMNSIDFLNTSSSFWSKYSFDAQDAIVSRFVQREYNSPPHKYTSRYAYEMASTFDDFKAVILAHGIPQQYAENGNKEDV